MQTVKEKIPDHQDLWNGFLLRAFQLLLTFICAIPALLVQQKNAAAQELDAARQHRLPSCARLAWDNIDRDEQVIRGIQPERRIRAKVSTVNLHPGEWTEFYVPPHEAVRVVKYGKNFDCKHLRIWTSNGSGLYRKIQSAISEDGQTIIAAPDDSDFSTARVGVAIDAPCPIRLAIFTSRRIEPQRLNYYQCKVIGRNCGVSIRDNKATKKIDYSELAPGKVNQIRLRRPTRLRIESRFKYDKYSQRRETFWLRIKVNGHLRRILTFDTVPQLKSRIFVDDCERLVGIPEFAYVDVGCSNGKVTIESSHSIYMRADGVGLDLCRSKINHIYKLPVVDRNLQMNSILNSVQFDPTAPHLSRHFLNAGNSDDSGIDRSAFDPYLSQQEILELARSNSANRGGLRAFMWMRAIATLHYGDAEHRQELTVADLAQRCRFYYTFFRDLLPQRLQPENEMDVIDYRRRRLRNSKNKFTEITIGENHIQESLETIKTATLFRLTKHDPELVYTPAKDLGTTLLRVVVDRQRLNQASKLLIQYDDGEPIEFWVEECSAVVAKELMPSRDEATIAALGRSFKKYDRGVLGGPYSQFMTPRPVTLAATADLILPARVQKVRAWVEGTDSTVVHVGLQTLDGRVYSLSEQAHRYLRSKQIDATSPQFQEFAQQAVNNETYPLQESLMSNQFTFNAGIENSQYIAEPTEVWGKEQIIAALEKAQALAQNEQWPSAIKTLSEIIQNSNGTIRRDSIVARVNALFSADEHYLATTEAIGWFANSEDQSFREQLIDILKREAASMRDDRQIRLYSAIAAINHGDFKNSLRLAEEYADHNRFRFALMTLLDSHTGSVTKDLVLRCSLQLGWWKLFDETLAQLSAPEKKYQWCGLKQLRQGNYSAAKRQLNLAGAAGKQWLDYWQQGDRIFSRLSNRNKDMRLQALEQWRSWQYRNPGPRQWVAQPNYIEKSSGTATVYATIAGTTAQYFLADADDPAMMEIEGPCRIKIEARPLHEDPQPNVPINDWLIIHNDANSQLIPIINNFPSRLLQIRGQRSQRIGTLVESEIEIPAGRNVLRFNAEKSKVLFRVLVSQPEIHLPILPQVNKFTVNSISAGKFRVPCRECARGRHQSKDCVRMVCRDSECCSTAFRYQCVCSGGQFPSEFNRAQSLGFHIASVDTPLRDAISAYRQAQRHGYHAQAPLEPLVALRRLLQDNPGRNDIKRMYSQIKQNFAWQRYRQFDSQAGIHSLNYTGWIPESPELRIRKSLMQKWDWEYALFSSNDLEINIQSEFETNCRLTLGRPRISFIPITQSTVRFLQPGGDAKHDLFDPRQIVELDATVAPGNKQLTLRQEDPTLNHIVGVNVFEILDNGSVIPLVDEDGMNNKQRSFQVATDEEPLKFRVAGPTIIRIDQSDDELNTIDSKTVIVSRAGREFELFPANGREQGYFRIFELTPSQNLTKPYRAEPPALAVLDDEKDEFVEGVIQQVAYFDEVKPLDTLSLRSPDEAPAEIAIDDYNELGFQERGTWFFDVGYQLRRSLAESPSPVETGRFFDVIVGRHIYNPWTDTYRKNQFLVRPRTENGTTFGYRTQGSTSLPFKKCNPDVRANGWSPYQFSWNGFAFLQNAGTPIVSGANRNPWLAGGRLRLSRKRQINELWSRRPTVTAHARFLSEDQDNFAPGDIDQDVFTPYKQDHRYGLRFSDKFVRQCCLDRRAWFRPYLATNEDQLVPDNLGFETGTDQLIGPLQLNLSYRFTRYLADNDRELSSIQNVVSLDAVLERWHSYRRRSEIQFSIKHDVDDDEGTSLSFNIVNFFNHGRGYRDFDPNQLQFKALKEHRAARHYHTLRQ